MLVYLDQNAWSTMVRSSPPALAELFTALRLRVKRGAALCPISLAHLVETARWSPDYRHQRDAAIDLMIEMSQGVCWRHAGDIVEDEVSGRFAERTGSAFVLFGRLAANAGLSFLEERLASLSLEDGLREVFSMASEDDEVGAHFLQFREVTVRGLEQHRGDVERQLRPDDAPGPISAAIAAVLTRRVRDPLQKVEPGDAGDLLHVLHASCADLAFLDGKHASICRDVSTWWPGFVTHDASALRVELERRLPMKGV